MKTFNNPELKEILKKLVDNKNDQTKLQEIFSNTKFGYLKLFQDDKLVQYDIFDNGNMNFSFENIVVTEKGENFINS